MNVTISEVFEALHNGNEKYRGAYIEKGSNVSFIHWKVGKTKDDMKTSLLKRLTICQYWFGI